MKNLLLLAVFVVVWKSYEAKYGITIRTDALLYPENGCYIVETKHREEFDDEMKALARYTALKMEKVNFNLKVYEEKRREIKP